MLMPAVMHAQEKNVTIITTTATACDTFAWNVNGSTYTATGVYTYVRSDTAFVLDLTLGHAVNITVAAPVNAGCSYVWGNDTITTSGVHTAHFTTQEGCDSAVTKTINIDTVEYTVVYDTACQSLSWYGLTLTNDTIVTVDTVMNGCNNNITLHLKVNAPRQITRFDSVVACDSYYYTFRGGYTGFTVKTDTDTSTTEFSNSSTAMRNVFHPRTKAKCYDSTFYLHVKINKANFSNVDLASCGSAQYVVGDTTYTYTYTILDTIKKVAKNVDGCDSGILINVKISQRPVLTISGDLYVAPGSSTTLTASSDQSNVKWQWSTGETSNTITINAINTNTDISLTGTNTTTNCASTNNVTILCNAGIEEAESQQVKLYPNPASSKVNIESAEAIQSIIVYNALGQQVYANSQMGTQTALDVSRYANGSYTLRMMLQDGTMVVRAMIINR